MKKTVMLIGGTFDGKIVDVHHFQRLVYMNKQVKVNDCISKESSVAAYIDREVYKKNSYGEFIYCGELEK